MSLFNVFGLNKQKKLPITGSQAQALFEQSLLKDLQNNPALSNLAPSLNPMGGISGDKNLQQGVMPAAASTFALNPSGGISGEKGAQIRSGLLGNLSNPETAPKSNSMGLLGNPLLAIGSALLNPRQSFGQNLQQGFQNLMQQQMYQQAQKRQDYRDQLALATLGIEAQKAKIPTYKSVQYFQSPDGKTTLSGFLTDRGLVDQSGNPLNIPAGFKPFNQPSQMLNVNMPGPQQEAARRLMIEEKVYVPQITNFQNQAMQSRNYATTSQNLVDIGRGLEGGTIQEIRREIKKLLPEFDFTGITDLENAKAQAFEAYLQKSIPAQRVAGSGSTSDIEFRGFKASLPNLLLTQTGREAVAEAANVFARRDAKVADYASNLLAQGKYSVTAVNQYADKIAEEIPLPDRYFREQENFLTSQGF